MTPRRAASVTFAAWACPHCPFEREASVAWLLNTLAALSPRPRVVVCLGDLFDAQAAARHLEMEDKSPLEAEFQAGASLLARVRAAVPHRCDYVWLHGNHDDNILRPDARRIPKAVRSLCNWNNHLGYGPEFRRWRQYPYIKSPAGCAQLGQVIFTHGFDHGVTSDEIEALQLAFMVGGRAFRLVVRGHTHRPVAVRQCYRTAKTPLPFWYANAGTIGPLQPLYMTRQAAFLWGPGLVVGEAAPRPNPLGGVQWSAHLLQP